MRGLLTMLVAGACGAPPAPALRATPTERAVVPSAGVAPAPARPCIPPPPGPLPYTDEFVEDTGRPLGALRGVVTETGDVPVAGATVVATSRVYAGEEVVISDETGVFWIDRLEPGTYSVVYYYDDATFTHDVAIHAGTTTVERVREFERMRGCRPAVSQPQRPAEVW